MRLVGRSVLGCIVACMLCGTAAGDPASDLLQRGIEAFGLAQFEASRLALETARSATRDPRLLARIELYLGLNAAVNGDAKGAREAFVRVLSHDPLFAPDPRQVKADLVELFSDVRRGLHGEVDLSSPSPPARATVDGKAIGQLPLKARLGVGAHVIEVRSSDGRARFRAEVLVRPLQTTRVVAELRRQSGSLTLRSDPAGAEVTLDGKPIGRTPIVRAPIEEGQHQLVLRGPGHHPWVRPLAIEPGKELRLEARLVPEQPREVAPRRARVWTWVTGALGLAALGAGIGVAASSSSSYGDWESRCSATQSGECAALEQTIRDHDLAANMLFAVAGGLAISSVVLFFLEGRRADSGPREPARASGPGGLALGW